MSKSFNVRLPALIAIPLLFVLFAALARAEELYRVVGVVSPDVLNVRAGPSASYPIVGTLPPDTGGISMVGECTDRWCPIAEGELRGWVNSRFLAVEEQTPSAPESAGTGDATRAVLPDGTLELTLPDGSKRRLLPSGREVRVHPDGTIMGSYHVQTQGPNLPELPAQFDDFGTKINKELLTILTNILSPEEFALYQQTEAGKSLYDLASWRIQSIEFLTKPKS